MLASPIACGQAVQPSPVVTFHGMSVTTVIPVGSFGHAPGGGSAVTVIAAVPLRPSLVAVIVAGPATSPLTSPLPLTVATAALLVRQGAVRPKSAVPAGSPIIYKKRCVAPPARLGTAGLT